MPVLIPSFAPKSPFKFRSLLRITAKSRVLRGFRSVSLCLAFSVARKLSESEREKGEGMMEWRGRRRQQQQEEGGWWGPTNRHSGKKYGRQPPSPAGTLDCFDSSWCQTVPQWEKRFCTDVCSIPWRKLCETKRVMSMYENVVQWNDSAGEEAFKDAKARFWAEINGLPCDIPLPDPDMYIDVVNQEAFVNPQLVEDLYKQPPTLDDGERDASCGWDSFIFAYRPVPASGWGDEDPVPTSWLGASCPAPTRCRYSVDPVLTNNITTEPHSAMSYNNALVGNLSYLATKDTGVYKNFDSRNVHENPLSKDISNADSENAWTPYELEKQFVHDKSWEDVRYTSRGNGRDASWDCREHRNTESVGRFSRKRNVGRFSLRHACPKDQA
ncbi:hypothetical protein OPV22_009875 [Ensete ventricosum]|uniref:Uncharacterized protein n=1 Tax=Ensete ventricosum TaxID=4639 RepID=A0AAV8RGW0_ENSVE|nr:hypothetical protein OPV22_009875 [Ensete ventricosum]